MPNVVTVSDPSSGITATSTVKVGTTPMGVVSCDVNGDKKADLIVVNSTDNTLTVLLGKGDGTFTASTVSLPSTGAAPIQAVCTDLNGDGNEDIAIANRNSQNVTILLGKGDGTFTAGAPVATGAGSTPYFLATADLNGDGHADLIVGNQSGSAPATVLLGKGDGTFTTAPSPGGNASSIAIGDFNGDGVMDLAYNDGNDDLHLCFGNGDGTFGAAVNTGSFVGAYFVATDLNGDSKTDIVDSEGNVLLGGGNGTFQSSRGYSQGSYVAVGDFNGDGKKDIDIVATGEPVATVSLGNGDGTFAATGTNYSVGQNPRAIAIGDFNGDGKSDFAVANSYDNSVTIELGK